MARPFTRDDKMVRMLCESTAQELWTIRDSASDRWLEIANELYPIARSGVANGVSSSRVDLKRERLRATNRPQELLKKGASGFAMHLTNPARPWFELGPSLRLAADVAHGVNVGLEELSKGMRQVFEVSGIYAQLNKLYEHLICFGTGCMLVFESNKGGYHIVDATTLRFGTYALGIDADGRVNRVVRKFEFTVNQLVEAFGTAAIAPDLKDAYDKGHGNQVRVTVVNLIEPNKNGYVFDRVSKLCRMPNEMAYRSIYWTEAYATNGTTYNLPVRGNTEVSPLLAVRGIRYNPIIAPRLEREAGDVWGRGRGIDALPVARTLAQLCEDMITVSGNVAMPALVVDESMQGREFSLGRGDINYGVLDGNRPVTQPAVPAPHNTNGFIDHRTMLEQELADVFFVSRFSIIDSLKNAVGDKKTATEINQLVRENMGLLGPVVTNLDSELLDPLVYVVMAYCYDRAEALGYDVDSIAAVMADGIKVRYVGEIHQAMKSASLSAIERSVAFAGQVAGLSGQPTAIDCINVETIVRDYCDALGLDPSNLTSPEDVKAAASARAQQAAQMAQAQMMAAEAKTMKDGASALKGLTESGVSLNDMAQQIGY